MKVAVVHSFYASAQPSGENAVVNDQVAALVRAGHRVALIAKYTDELQAKSGYEVGSAITVASGAGRSPDDYLASFNPDVVHLHNTFPNFGTRWLRRWGTRCVVTLHNYRTICSAGTLLRDGVHCQDCLTKPILPALRHRCYRDSLVASIPIAIGTHRKGGLGSIPREASEIVTLNDTMDKIVSAATGRTTTIIPNFVSHCPVSPLPTSVRWAFIGRVVNEKGIAKLLENWPRDQKLDIYGHGPERQKLQTQYARDRHITWFGSIPREEVLDRLGGYTGLVVPSLWTEGLPTVVLEALARGVPVVLSDRMATSQQLASEGVAQTLAVSIDTQASLTSCLRSIVDGGEAMRYLAQEFVRETYGEVKWVERMEQVYQRVIDGPKPQLRQE